MKKFIARFILFSAIAALLIAALSANYAKSADGNFVSVIRLKHERLNSFKGPRVMFAGGSNVAYGIDSREIEDSIKLPVTNLAIHAGLGLDFMLSELKHSARRGDFIFLSPEYYLDEGRYKLDEEAADSYPEARKYLRTLAIKDFPTFIDNIIEQLKTNKDYLFDKISKKIFGAKKETTLASITSFNEYGDVVAHLNRPAPTIIKDKKAFVYKYWDGIQKINELAQYASENGIHLYFVFPTYSRNAYNINKAVIKKYQNDLVQNLKVKVINSPEDFVYDDSEYYDTVYHLRKNAREWRTQKLISIIKPYTTL
ncbi:hypothetical protein [[Flexibacter] sp. ATCC 35208]|uniref:hypothetical protein n=1 Tax=[Flexibacter] sp. ATCC 35208 TaxID=1936242 RepID=UPI0009D45C7A|nr:hypothetical protein [[Flexibacter] sp. ATCC 35208]OMP75004.1 hypothetical protein BW716_32360 [[Flexibacter] sp. ATCC 35208]